MSCQHCESSERISRLEMNEETERAFVKDCFRMYEQAGFLETFQAKYVEEKQFEGKPFIILGRVKEWAENKPNGVDLEYLPMWNIEFEDGTRLMAYPEEICKNAYMEEKCMKKNMEKHLDKIKATFDIYMAGYEKGYTAGYNDSMENKTAEPMKPTMEENLYTEDEKIILDNGSGRWNIGDVVRLHFFGRETYFRVVHKNYFTENKIVLMPIRILCFAPFNMDGNDYANSYIRNYVNTFVLAGFLPEIRQAMTSCDVECWDRDNTIFIKDKIFVPSATELGLLENNNPYMPMEGQNFDYFKTSEDRRMLNGKSFSYWTRTPHTNISKDVWCVSSSSYSNNYDVTDRCGVAFAFEV